MPKPCDAVIIDGCCENLRCDNNFFPSQRFYDMIFNPRDVITGFRAGLSLLNCYGVSVRDHTREKRKWSHRRTAPHVARFGGEDKVQWERDKKSTRDLLSAK
jgi:hypothetical protein